MTRELLPSLLLPRLRKCQCPLCAEHRRIRAVLRRGDRKEMRRTIRYLSEALANTGEELEMANAYIKELTSGKEKSEQ